MLRALLIGSLLLQGGCVSFYRGVPKKAPVPPKRSGVLHYKLGEFPAAGLGDGRGALRDFFREETGFAQAHPVPEKPEKGLYVETAVKWNPPGVPALIFGYLSIVFLTLLPAFSLREGYQVDYHLYKDGKHLRTFSYDIKRKGAVWIVLLPLMLVNALTMSERDAFTLTSRRFLEEAAPLL